MEKIEKIMQKVDIQRISMKNMDLFKSQIRDDNEKYETIEVKNIYESLLEVGDTVVDLYTEAKCKYLKETLYRKENYMNCIVNIEKKVNQNNELKKDIAYKIKQLRKTNNTDERMRIFRDLDINRKIISLNESTIKISEDMAQAEIIAAFQLFNDLSRSVDEVYSDNDYIDNETIISNLKNIISIIVSTTIPGMGIVVNAGDIIKALFKITDSINSETQIKNSIQSIDKGIKQLKDKYTNRLVALLTIKLYLGDIAYVHEFLGVSVDNE